MQLYCNLRHPTFHFGFSFPLKMVLQGHKRVTDFQQNQGYSQTSYWHINLDTLAKYFSVC